MLHGRLGAMFLVVAIRLGAQAIEVPRVWDEAALKDWATPLPGFGLHPANTDRGNLIAFLRTL